MDTNFPCLAGFGNHFSTEAVPDTLPQGQNSPQRVNHGLYAEQISGSAFTAPKGQNFRSWLYRIRPSVMHGTFKPLPHEMLESPIVHPKKLAPMQMRWDPLPVPKNATTFIDGWYAFAGNGEIQTHNGATTFLYACNKSMGNNYFYSADGELLIVPEMGKLIFKTEMGILEVGPEEIIVIPRGVKFQVNLVDSAARGYICENHGQPFRLPERGPIGANGLANERDFLYPVAAFEDLNIPHTLTCKYFDRLWRCDLEYSPCNVVAWHGNYAPYKYQLKNFSAMSSVSFDHPDPSIFTVLTSPSVIPGTANVDFVIFPDRWMVSEHTFRPPYYHRNKMSELMGLIKGMYDAKTGGFVPGGISIHNCMTPHGPDRAAFEIASNTKLKPKYYANTMAFMFESSLAWIPTDQALTSRQFQKDYLDCWKDLPITGHFSMD